MTDKPAMRLTTAEWRARAAELMAIAAERDCDIEIVRDDGTVSMTVSTPRLELRPTRPTHQPLTDEERAFVESARMAMLVMGGHGGASADRVRRLLAIIDRLTGQGGGA